MKIHVLASGSAGNCALVEAGGIRLLVDAGLSGSEIERRLAAVGAGASDLAALLITHEHADHVRGAGVLARRHGLPVYLTRGTLAAEGRHLGELPAVHHIRPGTPFEVGMVQVHPFSIPHRGQRSGPADPADPVAYVFRYGGVKAGIATDLGHYPYHLLVHHLAACHLLVLEFNHDPELLRRCARPEPVKQWIRGREGHLSNEEGARLLADLLRHEQRLEALVLAHLSEENNTPALALAAARGALERFRLHERVELRVAGPDTTVTIALRR
ncbi:MAG TPA: MBL fold metallo-hydrolase [Candidatus Methanoperedens sp.]|nr:MBL fold metallo-hydrolase [Candidatus Methanoperedens sp.]